jgi:hypothetical protein
MREVLEECLRMKAESTFIVVYDGLPVTGAVNRRSSEVGRLHAGTEVEVLEHDPATVAGADRVRIQAGSMTGWISAQ